MTPSPELGRKGEDLAAKYLTKKGMTLLKRNVRTRYGEIDLILQEDQLVVFVEVKARSSDGFGGPLGAITQEKKKKISRAAASYLSDKKWQDRPARFDVVAILVIDGKITIDHYPDAFDFEIG